MPGRPRPGHAKQALTAVLLLLVGASTLAVPASYEGPVLLPISPGHGLSALDTVGACLLAVGATWIEVLVVWRLPRLGLTPRVLFGLGLLGGAGLGLLIASVFSGFYWWWGIGAAALGVVALTLVVRIARR